MMAPGLTEPTFRRRERGRCGVDTAAFRSETCSIRGSIKRPDSLHPWPIGKEARADEACMRH